MILNDQLRAEIRELRAAVRQLQRELLAARMAKITGDGNAERERLKEAINTPHTLVTVRNDDVFDVLWRSSLDREKLKLLTHSGSPSSSSSPGCHGRRASN